VQLLLVQQSSRLLNNPRLLLRALLPLHHPHSTTAAPPPPPPPSSTAEAPQATCTAVAKLNSVDVAIWTNYITDNGSALEAAEKDSCAFGVTGWSVASISRDWTAPDGTQWTANQDFQFSLTGVTHPTVLQCITRAIIRAGGPANTQDYPFASGGGVP
jgi:hypothetical protein